jgi:hypothetical protein
MSMPSLFVHNCFAALSVEEISKSNTIPFTDLNEMKAISNI